VCHQESLGAQFPYGERDAERTAMGIDGGFLAQ